MKNNTIIIGAGAAGLAVSACLKQKGISNIILEQSQNVGAAWRKHYDRLHLHTDKNNSQLPFAPFPTHYPRYISRDQLLDYFESYVQQFQLDIRFNQQVRSAEYQDGLWQVQTQDTLHTCANLVIATGYSRSPVIPHWRGQESFNGKIIHSSEYKNGKDFADKKVLVVGFGNSGGEIAIDLHEHGAFPSLAVRNTVNVIPRELFGIPILSIGITMNLLPPAIADAINAPILRMVIGDIEKHGLRKSPNGPAVQIRKDGRIPLIDIGTMKLIREGKVNVYSGVEEFAGNRVKFNGGKEAEFDSVILATGYRPRVHEFLKGAPSVLNEEGTPISTGKESAMQGLYFCGFYVSPTGMLREIGIEAKQISEQIAN